MRLRVRLPLGAPIDTFFGMLCPYHKKLCVGSRDRKSLWGNLEARRLGGSLVLENVVMIVCAVALGSVVLAERASHLHVLLLRFSLHSSPAPGPLTKRLAERKERGRT